MAYQSASCGQTFQLAVGTHPNQTIARNTSLDNCVQPVIFQASSGVSVSGKVILNGPRHLVLRGFTYTDAIDVIGNAQDILIDNVDGGGFSVEAANGVTVRNSDLGPCNSSGAGSCSRVFVLEYRPEGRITQNVLSKTTPSMTSRSSPTRATTGSASSLLAERTSPSAAISSGTAKPTLWQSAHVRIRSITAG